MLEINYKAINQIVRDLTYKLKLNSKTQFYQKLADENETSQQQFYRLIDKREVNTIKQLNFLADALGVDVMEIITIEPKDDALPITQIF